MRKHHKNVSFLFGSIAIANVLHNSYVHAIESNFLDTYVQVMDMP